MATREWMEDPVMRKVKQAAMKRGDDGIRQLTKDFRLMDANGNGVLSFAEFKNGLATWGIKLRDTEISYLIAAFDKDGDGFLGLNEFLQGVRGGLNPRRRNIVTKAFTTLDKDRSGFIELDELKERYDVSNHPAVLKGTKTEDECVLDFLENFDDATNPDGKISREEFEAYYAGVGQNIDSDDYFDMMITETFRLEDEARPRFAPREPRLYDAFGNMTSPNLPVTSSEVYSKTLLGVNNRNYNTDHMRGGRAENPSVQNKYLPHTWETTQRADYNYYDNAARTLSQPPQLTKQPEQRFSPTGDPILDKVRSKILKRAGKRGFRGLARILRIMDDNGNKKLDREELKEGFQTYQMGISAHELDVIFGYFDRNGDGNISVTEFIRGVRGPMVNPRRLDIVRMAWKRLDKTGDGIVNYADLEIAYDVEKHPAVLSKEKTPREVLQEFVEDWDKDGNGTITDEEFIDYYGDLSAGIDNDNYFELMIRNAWHISGGTGVAANTTCRRVLVTFMSGTQKVMEIKDDLGIRGDDIPRMLKALKSQGVSEDIKRIELAY